MSRHPADYLSLIFGLVFAAIGLVLVSGGDAALSLAWVAPLTAIALGGLVIMAARSTRTEPDGLPPED